MGIRRNNHALVHSGRFMFKELLHGKSHGKYQEIELVTEFIQREAPQEVKQMMKKHASVSKSGNPSSGQHFDFILEEDNKEIKAWVPKGTPSMEMWQAVIRNTENLSKIKENILDILTA